MSFINPHVTSQHTLLTFCPFLQQHTPELCPGIAYMAMSCSCSWIEEIPL